MSETAEAPPVHQTPNPPPLPSGGVTKQDNESLEARTMANAISSVHAAPEPLRIRDLLILAASAHASAHLNLKQTHPTDQAALPEFTTLFSRESAAPSLRAEGPTAEELERFSHLDSDSLVARLSPDQDSMKRGLRDDEAYMRRAHWHLAQACLFLCQDLGRLENCSGNDDGDDKTEVDWVVVYAWKYGLYHLRHSKRNIWDNEVAGLLDETLLGIVKTVTALLREQARILASPLQASSTYRPIDAATTIKYAHHAIATSLNLLSRTHALSGPFRRMTTAPNRPWRDEADDASKILQIPSQNEDAADTSHRRLSGLTALGYTAVSRVEMLKIDKPLLEKAGILDAGHKETVLLLSNLSRSLRLTLVCLSGPLLQSTLLSKKRLNDLFHTARFLENLASAFFWDMFPSCDLSTSIALQDQHFDDPFFEESRDVPDLVLDTTKYTRAMRQNKGKPSSPGISQARWMAARVLYAANDLKNLALPKNQTYTIEPSPRSLSFLHSFTTRQLFPFSSPPENPHLVLLSRGYRSALFYVLAAIIVNHIRRTLAPWLGQYPFYHPLEALKLARSSPHHFLQDSADFSWLFLLFMLLQDQLLLLLHSWAFHLGSLASLEEHQLQSVTAEQKRAIKWFKAVGTLGPRWIDISRILYLALTITRAEQTFSRSCSIAAHYMAYGKLLYPPSQVQYSFVWYFWTANPLKALAQITLAIHYGRHSILPATCEMIYSLARGDASLLAFYLVLWGAMAYTVVYSNKLFVMIEMKGLVLFVIFAVLALVYLAAELHLDPLDLRFSFQELKQAVDNAPRTPPQDGKDASVPIARPSEPPTTLRRR